MTRHDLLEKWAEIQRLEASAHPPDRVRALGLIDELATALDGKVLVLDDGTALYEHEDDVVTAEVFNDLV